MIYRMYDVLHFPGTAWRTLKNCIVTGTLKNYWSWLETEIIKSESRMTETLKEQSYYGELYDGSNLEW